MVHRGEKLIGEIISEVVRAQWNVASGLEPQALIDTLTAMSSALAESSDD